jgi:uncharacterized protein YbaP (TraB family)
MSKANNSLFWELQHPDAPAPSYLFGTMHVRDERVFVAIDYLNQYLQQCDAFAAEFNFEQADFARIQQAARLPAGVSLRTALSPSIYNKLARVVERELQQPLAALEQLSPMLLLNLLAEAQLNNDHQVALDRVLYDLAAQANKQLLGLETFEEQLAVFEAFKLKEQLRSLKQVATNFERYRRHLKKTTLAYINGDIHRLYQSSKRSIGGMRRVLLYDRNQKMAARFAVFAQEQALFAAIGAGHLAGQKGVLRLLKQRGYQLRALPYRLNLSAPS